MWEELDTIVIDHLMSVSLAWVARGSRRGVAIPEARSTDRLLPQISIPDPDEGVIC